MTDFIRTDRQRELYEMANRLAGEFSERSMQIDETGEFPFENFESLRKAGYMKLSVPKEYGGDEISLYEFVMLQEALAKGDASTALSIGWHVGITMDLAEKRPWPEPIFAQVCQEIVRDGVTLNNLVSEAATGSPTRGGKPQTTAVKDGDEWVLNGRKTFSTMAPILDYFLIVATTNAGEIAQFIVSRETLGLKIVETWHTMAMRGTGSHDLVLENVRVKEDALVQYMNREAKKLASGWLLHIPACYMGIALAARDYAVSYANSYRPNSIAGPISELPNIRQLIGEIELELMSARYFLYGVAERWDQDQEGRYEMHAELGAVKHKITNAAIAIVDKAMRVVGGQSLYLKNPMQKYYRDVRAGLHNPPMDDAVISMLASRAIDEKKQGE